MKVGTRYSMFLGGALFGTAFATAGAGVAMHSLPLLYFGNCKYAVIVTVLVFCNNALTYNTKMSKRS